MGNEHKTPSLTVVENGHHLQAHVYRIHSQLGWVAKIVSGLRVEQTFHKYIDDNDWTRNLEIFALGDSPSTAVDALHDRLINFKTFNLNASSLEVKGDVNKTIALNSSHEGAV
tara:strand:- start:29481 stop:29819 length:339 start_codon:yes stop_codon:yes gene_type:complete